MSSIHALHQSNQYFPSPRYSENKSLPVALSIITILSCFSHVHSACVPKEMSPVNALRSLDLYTHVLSCAQTQNETDHVIGCIALSYFVDADSERGLRDKTPRDLDQEKSQVSLTSESSDRHQKSLHELSSIIGIFPFNKETPPKHYVSHICNTPIETDFAEFPYLNTEKYDQIYGLGAAQKALDIYNQMIPPSKRYDKYDKTFHLTKPFPRMNNAHHKNCR
jgi:hypothetical protein